MLLQDFLRIAYKNHMQHQLCYCKVLYTLYITLSDWESETMQFGTSWRKTVKTAVKSLWAGTSDKLFQKCPNESHTYFSDRKEISCLLRSSDSWYASGECGRGSTVSCLLTLQAWYLPLLIAARANEESSVNGNCSRDLGTGFLRYSNGIGQTEHF